jgi:16S rRNA (guanine(527)-N(7))-methyltransferase RsmG
MELSSHMLNAILPSFSPSLHEDLTFYLNELIKWNKKINLISRSEKNIAHHFIDSLNFAAFPQPDSTVIDIGTGAGFPGFVTALARRDLNITLYEPNNKKVAFLHRLKTELKVDIEICNERVEPDQAVTRRWNHAVCKAFTNMEAWKELTTPLADTLWFLASENQKSDSCQGWIEIANWSHKAHGNRYLLKYNNSPIQ